MNISANKYDAIESIIFKEGLKITSLEVATAGDKFQINLSGGLKLVTPTKNYSGLKGATLKKLKNYRLVGDGMGIHWPDLDEDLSLKGFLKEFLSGKVRSRRKMVIS